jgi:hypothetical protein
MKSYWNFEYTIDDLLNVEPKTFKELSKQDRVKLRKSLNDSYFLAKGAQKEKIGQVLSVLIDIGMGVI